MPFALLAEQVTVSVLAFTREDFSGPRQGQLILAPC